MTTQHDSVMLMESGYVPVNDLEMYYEIHGSGRPLVLLHGNLSTIETSFGNVLPQLASTRRMIAVEQQGHGHTADIDRPFCLRQWAEDTIALLRHFGIEQADFFGYSSGGAVALEIALHKPALVRKLVWAGGTSYQRDGLYPELTRGGERMKPEDLDGSPFHQAYLRVAPHPEQWHRLVAKIGEFDCSIEDRSREELAALQAPALLIIGDSDIVRPEHTVEMFRLLGGGVVGDLVGLPRSWLAVLPGTTHVTLVDRAEWLISMITEFLDAPMGDNQREARTGEES
ncbi:MAG TPA: alpha/beta hydrolase [Ktedonobacteraceae bacterium]|nr:alpha/beta hydrolase [Ktedonobacteraceae bacterium]